jgi:hypothetical protein
LGPSPKSWQAGSSWHSRKKVGFFSVISCCFCSIETFFPAFS